MLKLLLNNAKPNFNLNFDVPQVNAFVFECKRHVQQNPLDVIAVHCTHGFNRTGFLIAAFLIQTEDWSPEAAVEAFAKSRPPGIYKAGASFTQTSWFI